MRTAIHLIAAVARFAHKIVHVLNLTSSALMALLKVLLGSHGQISGYDINWTDIQYCPHRYTLYSISIYWSILRCSCKNFKWYFPICANVMNVCYIFVAPVKISLLSKIQ